MNVFSVAARVTRAALPYSPEYFLALAEGESTMRALQAQLLSTGRPVQSVVLDLSMPHELCRIPEAVFKLLQDKTQGQETELPDSRSPFDATYQALAREYREEIWPLISELQDPFLQALEPLLEGGALLRTTGDSLADRRSDMQEGHLFASITRTYVWPDGAMEITRHGGRVRCVANFVQGTQSWEGRLLALLERFPPHSLEEKAESAYQHVFVLAQGERGLAVTTLGVVGTKFEPGNYDEATASVFKYVATELNAQTPTGRLTVLAGPPGSGKSYFLRGLINEVSGAIFLLVPSELVCHLGQPGMLTVLMRLRQDTGLPIVLVLEDAEQALAPRMTDNIGHVAALLNFSDGLFGELLDLRIVATTNARTSELDAALKRNGRLLLQHYIPQPDAARAVWILERLLKRGIKAEERAEAAKFTNLGSVYKYARTLGWAPKSTARTMLPRGPRTTGGGMLEYVPVVGNPPTMRRVGFQWTNAS